MPAQGLPWQSVVKTLPSNAGGAGSIPGQDPTCLAAKKQNIKQKQYCNKFNKDLKKKRTNKNSNLHSGKQEFAGSPGVSFQDLGEQKAVAPEEISHLNMQIRKRIKGSGVTYGEHSGKVQRLGT